MRAKGESVLSRSILIKSLGVSVFIGGLWILAARSALVSLPFEWSGLTAALWFLPVLFSAEFQRERPVRGLLFLSEALASFVAVMGPLGWMSFQFGLAQGAAAEAAYGLRRTPGVALLGALSADLAVMALHPQLKFAAIFGPMSWGLHVGGALVSIFLATTLVVGGAIAWRKVNHTHVVFLIFLLPVSAGASPCEVILRRIGEAVSGPFVIAVDFDGTAVDTDRFLVQRVIPGAVNRVLDLVPPDERRGFHDYLAHLEQEGVAALPEFFEEDCWRRAPWPFPLAALPSQLAARPGLPPGSSPLVGFWSLMAEVFEQEKRSEIPVLPAFEELYRRANMRFGSDLHWVVITARHDGMLDDIPGKMHSLGPSAHPVGVLGRGRARAMDPKAVPGRKAEQIAGYRGPNGSRVRVFVENDPRNLAHLRELDRSIVLLRMSRDSAGNSELTAWDG